MNVKRYWNLLREIILFLVGRILGRNLRFYYSDCGLVVFFWGVGGIRKRSLRLLVGEIVFLGEGKCFYYGVFRFLFLFFG